MGFLAPLGELLLGGGGELAGGELAGGAGAGLTFGGVGGGGSTGAIGSIMGGAMGGGGGLGGTARNYLALHGLGDMMGQGQQQGQAPAQGAPAPTAPAVQPPSAFMAHQELSEGVLRNFAADEEFKSPSSQDRIVGDEDNDFDEKEKSEDQKDKDLQVGEGVNDMGGTDQGPDGSTGRQFDPNGEGIASFVQALPMLLGLLAGGGVGQAGGDHVVNQLHQTLEAEHPGYLNDANDEEGKKLLIAILGSPEGSGDDPALKDNDEPHDPIQSKVLIDGLTVEAKGNRLVTLTALENGAPVGYAQVAPRNEGVSVLSLNVPPKHRGRGIATKIIRASRALWPTQEITSAGPATEIGKRILSKVAFDQTNNPLRQPGMEPLNTSPAPFVMPSKGRCAVCGSTIDPHDTACSQCGTPNSPTRLAGVGPTTDEQKEAVAELLLQEGRQDEIPTMITNPHEYADELAEITGQDNPPQPDTADQPPPPMAPPGGGMPTPGMDGGGGAPPGGGGMGMPGMMSSLVQYGGQVDGIAGVCPKCKSHSTGYLNDDGDVGCKTCGHQFKEDGLVGDAQRTADQHVEQHGDNFDNSLGVDAADALGQRNIEHEQDSSLSWVDDQGDPLQSGKEYEMYSDKYDIPDIIKIDQVKPDEVVYTLTGEYGLDHRTKLTYEEANLENIHFVPAHGEGAELGPPEDSSLEQNMDDIPRPDTGTTQTDLSTPHTRMTHEKRADLYGGPQPTSPDTNYVPEGGLGYTQEGTPCPTCNGEGCPECGHSGILNDDLAHYPFRGDETFFPPPPGQDVGAPGENMRPQGSHHEAAMTAQDFRLLADAIRTAPAENKLALAEHFANALGNTNPMFDAERFMAAAAGEPTSGRDVYNPGGGDAPPVIAPGEQTTLASVESAETVNVEPNWEAFRAWVLNLAKTDPAKAQEIANEMGYEAPPELVGVPVRQSDPGTEARGQLIGELDRTQDLPTTASTEETGPEWLMDGMTHTGGAKFTPNEQRTFVEEDGVARNADKLNLAGTHYESSDDVPDDQFLFGL